MSEAETRFHFYGRRRGKTLRRHHSALMAELLPALRVDLTQRADQSERETWRETWHETWLEIGFGGGEHLAHQAASHPQIDFIGAEPFQNGVAKLLAHIEAQALKNIRIHDDDVRYLLTVLPAASLSRIFVLYPDPWPKKRHHERRIVNAETLRQFHHLLKADGLFLFASDIADYVQWVLDHVAADGGFELVSNSEEPFENWLMTRYEAKAKREGRSTRYLTYRRKA